MDEPEHSFSVVELIRDRGPVHQLLLALMVAVTAFVVITAIRRRHEFTGVAQHLIALSFLPVTFASVAAHYWFVAFRSVYAARGIFDPGGFPFQIQQGTFALHVGWCATVLCLIATYATSRIRNA